MSTKGSVLITGCSDGGIGYGLARTFQERGYHVFATARDPSKMEFLKLLPNVTLLTLDVVNNDHIASAVEAVSKHTGGTLSYLINNAGRNHFMPLLDDNIDAAKKIFETNVWGPLAIMQAFAPLLIKAQGTLISITSIAGGHGPVPLMGSYGASKMSLEHMTEVLRLELSPFNVKALSVVTGAVATNGQTYFGDWALPKGSRYSAIEDCLGHVTRGTDGLPRMPLSDYSNEVVDKILEGVTGKIWVGERAPQARDTPLDGEIGKMRDEAIIKGFQLDKLA